MTWVWTPAAVAGALTSIDQILETGALANAMEIERIAGEVGIPL